MVGVEGESRRRRGRWKRWWMKCAKWDNITTGDALRNKEGRKRLVRNRDPIQTRSKLSKKAGKLLVRLLWRKEHKKIGKDSNDNDATTRGVSQGGRAQRHSWVYRDSPLQKKPVLIFWWATMRPAPRQLRWSHSWLVSPLLASWSHAVGCSRTV